MLKLIENSGVRKPIPGGEGKSQQQHQQPQQSHLMDLLDISLGAASISGPSQSSDPWGLPMGGESKNQVNFN